MTEYVFHLEALNADAFDAEQYRRIAASRLGLDVDRFEGPEIVPRRNGAADVIFTASD